MSFRRRLATIKTVMTDEWMGRCQASNQFRVSMNSIRYLAQPDTYRSLNRDSMNTSLSALLSRGRRPLHSKFLFPLRRAGGGNRANNPDHL